MDIPYVESEGSGYIYSTIPMGIVLVDEIIITVCTRETPIIADFTEERVRNFWTFKRTRFILQLLYRNASRFLAYLKQIDKASMHVQDQLEEQPEPGAFADDEAGEVAGILLHIPEGQRAGHGKAAASGVNHEAFPGGHGSFGGRYHREQAGH